MLEIEDVDATVESAIEDHLESAHRPTLSMLPIRPFRAKLEEDWVDHKVDPACLVIGVIPCASGLMDPDDMPSLNFVVIAPLQDGTIIPRVVPTVVGTVPHQNYSTHES